MIITNMVRDAVCKGNKHRTEKIIFNINCFLFFISFCFVFFISSFLILQSKMSLVIKTIFSNSSRTHCWHLLVTWSGTFIVNFQQMSMIGLIFDFEQVNASQEMTRSKLIKSRKIILSIIYKKVNSANMLKNCTIAHCKTCSLHSFHTAWSQLLKRSLMENFISCLALFFPQSLHACFRFCINTVMLVYCIV